MTDELQPLDHAALQSYGIHPGVIRELSEHHATLALSPTQGPFPVGICTVKNGGNKYPQQVVDILEDYFKILGHDHTGDGYEITFQIA